MVEEERDMWLVDSFKFMAEQVKVLKEKALEAKRRFYEQYKVLPQFVIVSVLLEYAFRRIKGSGRDELVGMKVIHSPSVGTGEVEVY